VQPNRRHAQHNSHPLAVTRGGSPTWRADCGGRCLVGEPGLCSGRISERMLRPWLNAS
jgi:hypothetical protein